MYYAGIGSRQTPQNILDLMTTIAYSLAQYNYILRSGGAIGADTAFERGAGTQKSIFYAKDATREAIELASKYHPAWHRCSDYAKQLHGRNMHILLGSDINNPKPVDFIVCWTPNGQITGGTGQALRYALDKQIKIYNLFKATDQASVTRLLDALQAKEQFGDE